MRGMHIRLVVLLVALGALAAPLQAQRERLPAEDREIVEKRWPEAVRTATSLRYVILKEGKTDSPLAQSGQYVSVLFKGMLLDGKVFDQADDPAKPFKMKIGRSGLIAAWEETLPAMHVGERRLIIVPYELGYGTRGRSPDIPRRATLVFEIEMLAISDE